MRVLIYWLRIGLRLHVAVPKGLLNLAMFAVCSRVPEMSRPYAGIQIVASPPYKVNDLTEIVAALELVRSTDPRRFVRIQRFIKRIQMGNLRRFIGRYEIFGQFCMLKVLQFPESQLGIARLHYVATVFPESTPGLLF